MQSDLSSLENTGTVRSGMGRACEREKENKHACREARQEPMTHAQGPGDELGLGNVSIWVSKEQSQRWSGTHGINWDGVPGKGEGRSARWAG